MRPGVILEDQEWPKRCGHLAAAVAARGDRRLMITGRTDALATHGIDEAIRRARLYKDAGADVLFVEGPRTRDELARIGAVLPGPLAVNLIEGGVTPLLPLEELASLGFFSVGFVLSGLFAATQALEDTYAAIFETGSTQHSRMRTFDAFADLVGTDDRLETDAAFRR